MDPLGRTLRVVARRLTPALASAETVARLARLVDDLPDAPRALLERRLGGTATGLDISLCTLPPLRRKAPGIEAAAPGEATNSADPRARRIAAWLDRSAPASASRALSALHRAWEDPESVASASVGRAWIEVDTTQVDANGVSPAALFLGLRAGARPLRDVAPYLPVDSAPVLESALFQRVLGSLPECARVTFLGAWAGREVPCLRVNVAGLPDGGLVDYLLGLGWRGPTGDLASLVAEIVRCGASPILCFDIGPPEPSGRIAAPDDVSVRGRVSVEAMLDDAPLDGSAWRPLLDAFLEHKLCTTAETEAILGWGGISDPAADAWPMEMILDALLRGPSQTPVIFRHVNHLKIVVEPGAPPLAKAYLAFGTLAANVTRRARDVRGEDLPG